MENRREFFRLAYPSTEKQKPIVVVDDSNDSFAVIDVSEGGIRVAYNLDFPKGPGQSVMGSIIFPTGKTVHFQGRILSKLSKGGIVIAFEVCQGISFSIIMEEQRRLLKKYSLI